MLVSSFMILSMLSVASLGLATRQVAFLVSAEHNTNKMVAFNMAEAGTDLAMSQLSTNTTYAGSRGYVVLGNQGGYSVTVCPPTCNGLTAPTDATMRLIMASGFSPSNTVTARAYETRAVTAYAKLQPKSPFVYSIFGGQSISINGSPSVSTDSYNSTNAPYNPLTAGSNGSMATDSTVAAAVNLSGNVTIKGDVVVGLGGNPTSVISQGNNVTITGTRSAASALQNPQPITSSIPSEGALSVGGQTNYVLQAGTHRFSSISVSGGGIVTTTGPVTIYVDGPVSVSGHAIITAGDAPPNCQIYVTTNTTVSISGGGSVYAAIYAPQASVSNTGNGELFGAVVASTYTQSGNGKAHYDEALKNVSGGTGNTVHLRTWVENNTYYANQ